MTLSGTIESGGVLINNLVITIENQIFETPVGEDGIFSKNVVLNNGINHIKFQTWGDNNLDMCIMVPNNMETQDFTLNLVDNIPNILVTLNWDTNDTDLDLYVIDPTGDYSAYYHKTTNDGGELDYDDTDGYGPEHWTLEQTDTVRYGSAYKVRIHYYSDHGNGPSNYTVKLEWYDSNTHNLKSTTYTGVLVHDNPSNDGPSDTGSDWVDIGEIILSNVSGAAIPLFSSTRLPETASVKDRNYTPEEIIITAPVPPANERLRLK